MLFTCRLRLEEDKYYPISINKDDRYIGAIFKSEEKVMVHENGMFSRKEFITSDTQDPIAVNTLAKLKTKEAWKKNIIRRKVNKD